MNGPAHLDHDGERKQGGPQPLVYHSGALACGVEPPRATGIFFEPVLGSEVRKLGLSSVINNQNLRELADSLLPTDFRLFVSSGRSNCLQ